MNAEVLGNLTPRDIWVSVERDCDDIIAELFGKRGGIVIILPDQRSASQIECHLFMQQTLSQLSFGGHQSGWGRELGPENLEPYT